MLPPSPAGATADLEFGKRTGRMALFSTAGGDQPGAFLSVWLFGAGRQQPTCSISFTLATPLWAWTQCVRMASCPKSRGWGGSWPRADHRAPELYTDVSYPTPTGTRLGLCTRH